MRLRRFRRFRKRRSSKYHHRKGLFARRVLRAAIVNAGIKEFNFAQVLANTLPQGDGVSRELTIYTPWSGITQGSNVGQFEGQSIFPRLISVRGLISAATNQEFYVRFFYFWSRTQANYNTGQVFGNTTTAAANPTQVPPFANPQIFDDVTSAAAKYVGSTFGSRFDPTQVKIIGVKTIHVNAAGSANPVKLVKFSFKHPRRRLVWNDTGEVGLGTAPNYPLVGQYYFGWQVFGPAGTANTSSTSLGTMDLWCRAYFKDPSG